MKEITKEKLAKIVEEILKKKEKELIIKRLLRRIKGKAFFEYCIP